MYLFFGVILILYFLSLRRGNRVAYFPFGINESQSTKGILSLLIVATHIQVALPDIRVLSLFYGWGAPIVSLFLFIAGYGLMASYLKKGEEYLNGFLQKRVWKVLKPFLIITSIYIGLSYLDKGSLSATILSDLVLKGITPLPNSWFVFAIILFYIFFYISFRFNTTMERKLLLSLVLSAAYLLAIRYAGYDRCWWVTAFSLPAGLLYGYHESFFTAFLRKPIWLVGFVPASCLLIYLLIRSGAELLFPIAYIVIPLLIITLLSHFRFLQAQNRALAFLGSISYEIYLFHGVFIVLLRGNTVNISSDYIYMSLIYLLTILSAWCLNRGISRLKKELK